MSYKIYPNIYGKLISVNQRKGNIFLHITSFNSISEPLIRILEKIYPRDPDSIYIYDFDYIFDRRLESGYLNIGTLTDEHFAVKINSAVKSLMLARSLGESSENIQQACTMLLNYITKNPKCAAEYFPDFASEENRMKLLTPNEALKLSDKASMLDGIIEKFNLTDGKEMERIFEEHTKQDIYLNGGFNELWDCGFGSEDVDGMSRKEYEEFCRKVGTSGENYVFEEYAKGLKRQAGYFREETRIKRFS